MMRFGWVCLAVGALCLGAPAFAQDEADDVERVTGRKPPPLPSEPQAAYVEGYKQEEVKDYDQYKNRPYDNKIYIGAEALQMDPQYIFEVHKGLEMIYLRDYNGAKKHFKALDSAFPGTGISALVDTLVWQALMLENFDYRYEDQYWVSSKRTRTELDAAASKAGNEGWEQVLLTVVSGIEAIHTMRRAKYLNALQLAFESMDHLQKAREAAPDFNDLLLADGMYNYWRTVVTLNSSVLPDFGDKRVEGIEQMQQVERSAVFLGPAATLSLAFTWLEEGDTRRALMSCVRNRKAYPDNVVNNLVTGTTYIYMKKYRDALTVFDDIVRVSPKNNRVHYWRGVSHLKLDELDEAEKELTTYLGADHLEDYQRAGALWRMGLLHQKRKEWGEAYTSFIEANKSGGHKASKAAADRLKKRKKDGKIDF